MDWLTLFPLRLSLQVAAISTLIVAVTGIAIAYVLARKEFRGKDVADVLVTLPLVLPPTVTGYYLIVLFGRNGYIGKVLYEWTGWSIMFTWQAAVLAACVVSLPLMIRTTRAAIESVGQDLVNASYTLGRSEYETALRVIFPLAKRGIMAGVVLAFARAMGEFGATLMIAGNIPGRTNTMPITIYTLAGSGEWGQANVMVLILTMLSGVFLFMANRYGRSAV